MAGRRPIIDPVKLAELLREGKTQRDCSRFFGVSDAAVSLALKKLNTDIVPVVAIENAREIAQTHLDMAGQLRKINDAINQELDRAQEMIPTNPKEIDIEDLTRIQGTIVKMAGEIRQQLSAQVEIFEAYRDFKEYQKWKDGVLTVLMKFGPEDRSDCIQELKDAGLLRGSAEVD